jgi:hypothetical protein
MSPCFVPASIEIVSMEHMLVLEKIPNLELVRTFDVIIEIP